MDLSTDSKVIAQAITWIEKKKERLEREQEREQQEQLTDLEGEIEELEEENTHE
jgi:hypothetical protein